jgi:hypothetical protein
MEGRSDQEVKMDADDDAGARDFWYGVIGIGLMVVIAICLAIFS